MTAEQSKAFATLDISRARRAEADMAQSVTLVTGASGFLGKAVTKQLAENSVCTVGLDPRPSPTTHVVDALSDRQKLKMLLTAEKITHIIHAGGVSGPMVLADDPAEVIAINVLGSLNLLYAALESGVIPPFTPPRGAPRAVPPKPGSAQTSQNVFYFSCGWA